VKCSYRVEIVRRRSDRFGWRVVAIDGARRREVGRSERSYRSRKKVRQAIDALQVAYVDDTTRPRRGSPLPDTTFEVIPGVLPLIVADRPVEYSLAARRRDRVRADDDETVEQDARADTAVQALPAEMEGKGRLGRRAKKSD
jgi:hypothetical protein